jgi:hypothetical protein
MAGARSRLVLAALALSSPASAEESLCSALHDFETAPAKPADNPGERRWLEIHWAPDSADWARGCSHSTHDVGTITCLLVMNHIRGVDEYAVPQSIMGCYGYRFVAGATLPWKGLVGHFVLREQAGRRVSLDLDFRDLPDGEGALRLTMEEIGKSYRPATMPRIQPYDATTR